MRGQCAGCARAPDALRGLVARPAVPTLHASKNRTRNRTSGALRHTFRGIPTGEPKKWDYSFVAPPPPQLSCFERDYAFSGMPPQRSTYLKADVRSAFWARSGPRIGHLRRALDSQLQTDPEAPGLGVARRAAQNPTCRPGQ